MLPRIARLRGDRTVVLLPPLGILAHPFFDLHRRNDATMKCPTLTPTLVIADDARLAAQISCVLARPSSYVPVVDGPRMTRPDRDAEVIRRNNAAARVKADSIIFAGLPDDAASALSGRLPAKRVKRVATSGDVQALSVT